jgi:hypothetical protein
MNNTGRNGVPEADSKMGLSPDCMISTEEH